MYPYSSGVVERCAIYTRLSRAPDGSVEAVTRQEASAREMAARLGWPIAGVYVDNNLSAWRRGVVRPGWQQMLADVRTGKCDAIISYHGDRLVRSDRDLIDLFDLAEGRNLPLASVSGMRDLSNPDDRYILRIEVAGAIRESDNISRRVKAAAVASAAKGRPRSGRIRSYGYEKKHETGTEVVIVTAEADVIRQMAERIINGGSIHSVVRWLNDSRVPTVTGRPWLRSTVRNILTNPRISAQRTHRGVIVGPGDWEPILPLDVWGELQGHLTPRLRTPGRGGAVVRKHLLAGIALCGSCGRGLRSFRRTGGVYIYKCDNPICPGPKVSRDRNHLDAYVTGAAIARLSSPELQPLLSAPTAFPVAAAEIASLERRMDSDARAMEAISGDQDYDPALAMKRLGSYRRRIAELRAQMEVTSRQRLLSAAAGVTEQEWDSWPLERRHVTIAALFVITVLPTTRKGRGPFDPDAVKVELRGGE